MGRPINKRFIGNTSQTGQQIRATAYFPGDSATRTAYIDRQVGSNTYNMTNIGGVQSGRVTLVNGGVSLTAGQANIAVTPFGASGSGATASANIKIETATVITAGSGATSTYYVPGEVLYSGSGTFIQRGNVSVGSVKAGNVSVLAGGPGYTVGDRFTWGYAGFDVPPTVTVATTTGNGAISTVTFTPGVVSNVSVTNVTTFSSAVTSNAWANTASFAIRWDVNNLSVTNGGDYSVAPANTVSLTGSTRGTGATANLTWQVSTVRVTNGGSSYSAPGISFTGNATGVGVINAAGSITSISVTDPGDSYSNTPPTITIAPIAGTEYVAELRNRSVVTFSGNSYVWVDSGVTPVDGQAQLPTA